MYSIDEVFAMLGEEALSGKDSLIKDKSIEVDGYSVYVGSWRYRTFYQKGTKCACCGKEAKYFMLTPDSSNTKRAHFNLYSEDGTLFTKDHIIPKSAGGKDCIENFQTYCTDCNHVKADTIPGKVPKEILKVHEPPKYEIQAEDLQTGEIVQFVNIEKAAEWLCKLKITKITSLKDIINRCVKISIRVNKAITEETDYYGFKWSKI